ncbi:MAG: hypothetical protein LQ339_000714 [Xanthoria mediterranea]|nr:MAG: hypothetical protein LQ339_000714 [Xanthoria mediterranea]
MSFLKKYKSQFDDAKKKYMPKEEAHPQPAYAYQSQYGDPSQQQYLSQNNNNNNNLTPAVPPGWTPIWDPHSSQWTYQNAATGQTQTAHPDLANYGGQAMPPGGPVLDKDGKPKKDKNGLLMGAAGGVAGGMLGKWALKKAGGFFFFFSFWGG